MPDIFSTPQRFVPLPKACPSSMRLHTTVGESAEVYPQYSHLCFKCVSCIDLCTASAHLLIVPFGRSCDPPLHPHPVLPQAKRIGRASSTSAKTIAQMASCCTESLQRPIRLSRLMGCYSVHFVGSGTHATRSAAGHSFSSFFSPGPSQPPTPQLLGRPSGNSVRSSKPTLALGASHREPTQCRPRGASALHYKPFLTSTPTIQTALGCPSHTMTSMMALRWAAPSGTVGTTLQFLSVYACLALWLPRTDPAKRGTSQSVDLPRATTTRICPQRIPMSALSHSRSNTSRTAVTTRRRKRTPLSRLSAKRMPCSPSSVLSPQSLGSGVPFGLR